jgi:hypothetical protein
VSYAGLLSPDSGFREAGDVVFSGPSRFDDVLADVDRE